MGCTPGCQSFLAPGSGMMPLARREDSSHPPSHPHPCDLNLIIHLALQGSKAGAPTKMMWGQLGDPPCSRHLPHQSTAVWLPPGKLCFLRLTSLIWKTWVGGPCLYSTWRESSSKCFLSLLGTCRLKGKQGIGMLAECSLVLHEESSCLSSLSP